jgi:hypothetical protein
VNGGVAALVRPKYPRALGSLLRLGFATQLWSAHLDLFRFVLVNRVQNGCNLRTASAH